MAKNYMFPNSLNWVNKLPKFKEDCLLLTASFINKNEGWYYTLFEIRKTEGYNDEDTPCWYWGIFTPDGDEWGDISELSAHKYAIIQPIKKR